jgi:two-component system, chemotaxis family, chemotaxis protein CheY
MAKVLLVDDAAFMRMRCAKVLTKLGHAVVEAENGLQALDVFDREKPDLTLLDITMPEMDGIEALKAIKARMPAAKVAMVSAMGQQSMVLEAIKSGAADFVLKPFDEERLVTAVNKLLA